MLWRGEEVVEVVEQHRNDWSRAVGIEGHWEMGIDVGMGFMGGQGWIGYDSSTVIVGGPRPLLRALWGRLSNKSRLLLGTVHTCHQQVPCNEDGRGRGVSGREGSRPINFRSRNKQMDPYPWDKES